MNIVPKTGTFETMYPIWFFIHDLFVIYISILCAYKLSLIAVIFLFGGATLLYNFLMTPVAFDKICNYLMVNLIVRVAFNIFKF